MALTKRRMACRSNCATRDDQNKTSTAERPWHMSALNEWCREHAKKQAGLPSEPRVIAEGSSHGSVTTDVMEPSTRDGAQHTRHLVQSQAHHCAIGASLPGAIFPGWMSRS